MGKKEPKKRAWRKAEVEDVEEALEDNRLVAKLKNKVFSHSKKNRDNGDESDLFTIDTKGSSEGLSARSKRELARAKIFPQKGPNIGLTAMEEAKIERAERQLAAKRRGRNAGAEAFDLWGMERQGKDDEAAASRVRTSTKYLPQSVPKTLHHKVSAAPAVLLAHEGQSMNPAAESFEELSCMAAAREIEREHEVEALERKMQPMTAELKDAVGVDALKGLDDAAKIELYRSLVCSGAIVSSENGPAEASRRRAVGQKSQSQRNKEKIRKAVDAKQAQRQMQKKLEKSVGELGSIFKEMKEKQQWQQERREYREDLKRKHKQLEASGELPASKRLGRTKFMEEALDVPDAEAAGRGLRAMPLKASAVKDRLSSILRRGLLPAPPEALRSEVIRRKAKAGKLKRSRKFVSPLLRGSK